MCVANRIRIRIRIPTSWIRTGVGLEKTWVRTPLQQRWDRCQAKFLTSAKFLTYYCFSAILPLRAKE